MRFYSDVLNKVFDSEEELNAEESKYELAVKEQEEKKALIAEERANSAKEISELIEKRNALKEEVRNVEVELDEKLNEFISKYGSYHYSFSNLNNFIDYTFRSFFI